MVDITWADGHSALGLYAADMLPRAPYSRALVQVRTHRIARTELLNSPRCCKGHVLRYSSAEQSRLLREYRV